ncbi:MAG: hypothetical protein ACOYMV_10045 [Verrucomicrobiia bacterium]|jgi:hypothetical protein
MSGVPISSNGAYDDNLTLRQATDYLRSLLSEFPFSDWKEVQLADEDGGGVIRQSRSQAVQVAAMLSQFANRFIPSDASKMGFIWNANTPRSGKTLLAKLAAGPPNGGRVMIQSWNSKDEELRKVLDAEVLRASNYILFDNIRGHLASQIIEGFFTAPIWSGRVLGRTEMFDAVNSITIFMTGNDCTVGTDMAYRCLICDLFVEEANARDRKKIVNLIDDPWLSDPKNRSAILSALFAIMRYWDAAGRPPPTGLLRSGWEAWGTIIGGMVQFAGFGDCLAEPILDTAGDTETADVRTLVKLLYGDMQPGDSQVEFQFQRIVNLCYQEGLFDWMIDGKKDDDDFILKPESSSRLGKMLRRYAPVEGRRVFKLETDLRVGLKVTGKNRHRRYILSIVKD